MKKLINGVYVELTAEEIALLEAENANQPVQGRRQTPEERIAALEAALNALISGDMGAN
jgi:DNA-binding transcriptional regulator YdaS (Cro superfamily)